MTENADLPATKKQKLEKKVAETKQPETPPKTPPKVKKEPKSKTPSKSPKTVKKEPEAEKSEEKMDQDLNESVAEKKKFNYFAYKARGRMKSLFSFFIFIQFQIFS